MSAGATKQAGPTQSSRETRAGVLGADRPCTCCGYDLLGQTIVREPHYGLLIVRCPECATVAGLQEYPLLGRWGQRWGALLAVLWFIFLTAAWIGSGAALFGLTSMVAEAAASSYSETLRDLHAADTKQTQPSAPSPAPGTVIITGPGGAGTISTRFMTGDFEAWWKTQDPRALLAAAGGWRRAVDWSALWYWAPASLVLFAIGWFWSIALLSVRRSRVILWALAVLAVGALLTSFMYVDLMTSEPAWYSQAARRTLSPPFLAAGLLWGVIPLGAGLLLGRSLTRLLARALLPPRTRGALALLWLADGLPPPRARRLR